VGTAGGCNPVPLKAEVTSDDTVIIHQADVQSGERLFRP